MLALVVLACHAGSLFNSFQFDDETTILQNRAIRGLTQWRTFFTDARTLSALPENAAYRPLATLSLALDWRLAGGPDPRVFHLTQILLHLLVSGLLWGVLRRLLVRPGDGGAGEEAALFGAGFFALHRVDAELIGIITLRSELMAAAGLLGGLWLWLAAPRLRGSGAWLLPVALGALAKVTALVFAPLLVLLIWLRPEAAEPPPARRRLTAGEWLTALVAILVCAALARLLSMLSDPHVEYGNLNRWVYFRTQIFAWAHYLRLAILPLGLSPAYPWDPIRHWYDSRVVAGASLALAWVAWTARRAAAGMRLGRTALFGALWFYAALAPSSSILPLKDLIFEYRLYLPLAGFALFLSALSAEFLHGTSNRVRGSWRLAAVALLVAHGAGVAARTRDYRSPETLWFDAARTQPHSVRAREAAGRLLLSHGEREAARREFIAAERLAASYFPVQISLARLEMDAGEMAAAEKRIAPLRERLPSEPEICMVHAEWLTRSGRREEAITELEGGVAASPGNMLLRHALLSLLDEAKAEAELCRVARAGLNESAEPALAAFVTKRCPAGTPETR